MVRMGAIPLKALCMLAALWSLAVYAQSILPNVRPAVAERTFTSAAINSLIDQLVPHFADPDIARLFSNCLPNTLDTTVYYHGDAEDGSGDLDSFVITGDIKALWLRDSTNQVIPYIPYASEDPELFDLISGLINRQAKSVLINPFANSFNFNASGEGAQSDNTVPHMTPTVFENKYEIDSISAFLKLSFWHWQYNGDSVLDTLATNNWLKAAESVVDTITSMQADDGTDLVPHYKFQRLTSTATDTLYMGGRGPPGRKSGLSRSLFRPSDDAVTLPYNVPGNAMACVELVHLESILNALLSKNMSSAENLKSLLGKTSLTQSTLCAALGDVLNVAANADEYVIPYEVDGGRSKYFMDDANVPSLLSLPVLGFLNNKHPLYAATRQFVLSSNNAYFFQG
jgi:meiotically up-regulated gene 157 (Mug157) protein